MNGTRGIFVWFLHDVFVYSCGPLVKYSCRPANSGWWRDFNWGPGAAVWLTSELTPAFLVGPFRRELNCLASFLSSRYRMRGVCFVHVLFLHVAKRPNGRLAQVLGTPVKFPSDSRAIAIPWHRSSSSQKALWCRGALRVGGVRWAVEVSLGLSLKLLFCNPFLTSPNLIFFNCHSHNLVISTSSIVR